MKYFMFLYEYDAEYKFNNSVNRCPELKRIIDAPNRDSAWKYYLLNPYYWGTPGENYGHHFWFDGNIKICVYKKYINFVVVETKQDFTSTVCEPNYNNVIDVFEKFCIDKFNDPKHYKWTYHELDKYINELAVRLLNCDVVTFDSMTDNSSVSQYNLVEYKLNDDHKFLFEQDCYAFYSDIPNNCTIKQNFKLITNNEHEILKKESCIYQFYELNKNNNIYMKCPKFIEDNAAIVIQNAWRDAIVNPNCKIGIKTINRHYDDMQSGTL